MFIKSKMLYIVFILISFLLSKNEELLEKKIVSIGGSITEIVFELGLGENVIGVDQSSVLPKIVKELPQVGYIRRISSEGVLSMMPTIILTNTEIGPKAAVDEIKNSGVKMNIYDAPKNLDGLYSIVNQIGNDFDLTEKAEDLINKIQNFKVKIDEKEKNKKQNKVIFIMNPSNSSYNAAGSKTVANYLIKMINGINLVENDFAYYRPINKEQLIMYNPDVLIIASHYDDQDAINHFMDNVDFSNLNSVKNKNVISIPLSNLTMGPSFIKNAISLLDKIKFEN